MGRFDGLLIPVGPLDQPDGDGGSPFLRPLDQVLQIGGAIPQVGLERDADIGATAKLFLRQDLLEDPQGQRFVTVLFHIKMHRHPQIRRPPQQDPDPVTDFGLG